MTLVDLRNVLDDFDYIEIYVELTGELDGITYHQNQLVNSFECYSNDLDRYNSCLIKRLFIDNKPKSNEPFIGVVL